MVDEPKDQMTHMQFLRAQFFSAEAVDKAGTVKVKRRRRDPDIAALAKFAKALEGQDQNSRRAAIGWLADKFLGIKLGR